MPSSVVQNFDDPDAYAAAIRAAQVNIIVNGSGGFTVRLTKINLPHLWMQRLSDNQPRILHAACFPARAIITFVALPGQDLITDGMPMPFGAIMRHSEADNFHQRSPGALSLAAMSLPIGEMASVGAEIAGRDLTPPPDPLVVKPPPSAIATLQRLHAAAGHLAETAPEIVAHPEAARGLEQALIAALVDCLGSTSAAEESSALRQHKLIMRRFHAFIEQHLNQALYVPEICRAIGVSERTLRTCCQEQPGLTPSTTCLTGACILPGGICGGPPRRRQRLRRSPLAMAFGILGVSRLRTSSYSTSFRPARSDSRPDRRAIARCRADP